MNHKTLESLETVAKETKFLNKRAVYFTIRKRNTCFHISLLEYVFSTCHCQNNLYHDNYTVVAMEYNCIATIANKTTLATLLSCIFEKPMMEPSNWYW